MAASDEKTMPAKCRFCGAHLTIQLKAGGKWRDYFRCETEIAQDGSEVNRGMPCLESQNAALASQLAAMQERCERLAAILKSLEWSGVDRREYETVYFCPTCLRRRPEHNPNCELAAALAQQEGRNAE